MRNLNIPARISTVSEDGNGALLLATNQRVTSRTRCFQVKWHFFWEHVKSGKIKALHIPTDEQRADCFTKMSPREVFEKIRKMVQRSSFQVTSTGLFRPVFVES